MTTNLTDYAALAPAAAHAMTTPQTFQLQAYCYDDRIETMPEILTAFALCGGWVMEKRTVSSTVMEYTLQLQLDAVLELYSGMVSIGLELTRAAHATLTDLCTCRKYQESSVDGDQTLTVRLSVSFLADVTLHSILMTGSGMA